MFTQTKAEANELYLSEKLKGIEVLHGDIPQTQREITFKGFKEGRFHILVATDVASRGLDIPDVDLIVQCEPPKDVETYIHRSGRTARAGNKGTVVTFYNKKYVGLISRIESQAGIAFTKIGVPQPEDIIKASSKFIVEGLKKVSDEALPLFNETADTLVKEFGEKKALLLTLAYISGNLNKIKKRSLLSGNEGYQTYQIDTDKEFRTVSYVWGILRRILPGDEAEQVRQMRCFKNNMGAAFDCPEALIGQLEAAYEKEKSSHKYMTYTITRSSQLPDLIEMEPLFGGYGRGRPGDYSEKPSYGNHTSYRRENTSYSPSKKFNSDNNSPARDEHKPQKNENEIFLWGLKTEDDIKDFLTDNKIGWQKIKLLTDDKGESKLVAFVVIDKLDIEQALKLNGSKVKGRMLRINLSSDKPKRN